MIVMIIIIVIIIINIIVVVIIIIIHLMFLLCFLPTRRKCKDTLNFVKVKGMAIQEATKMMKTRSTMMITRTTTARKHTGN